MKNIEILYDDCNCIIVNKPAGLAVQGGEGVKTSLDKLLLEHFRDKGETPLLVHRLDKDTSGVLLAAKGREAANRFSKIFDGHSEKGRSDKERKAVKLYIAVCAGCPAQSEGIIKDELKIRGDVKKSETKYKVIKTSILQSNDSVILPKYSVLELELGTGRMHQIRRHLAMNAAPILGDDKYGDFSLNKKLRKETGLKRMLLHASRLIIREEFNIDVTAPLPEYFGAYV
ncbi:MAG: RNA pseudouridine synthase [Treponema sp.]|nr:RNA pseudouridine synthase [Treponema sp.]MCL2237877.1 RNA pseudouridine synthase [Treponema sp.]